MPAALTIEEKVARSIAKKNAELTGIPVQPKKEYNIRKVSEREARPARGTFNGTRGKLKVDDDVVKAFQEAGWHLYIFNDSPGRIEDALSLGYEFVNRSEIGNALTDNVVPSNTDLGDKVRFRVGVKEDGESLFAYLMKIPLADYEVEQAALQSRNDRVDEAIRAGKNVKAGDSPAGFYDAGISIKTQFKKE